MNDAIFALVYVRPFIKKEFIGKIQMKLTHQFQLNRYLIKQFIM